MNNHTPMPRTFTHPDEHALAEALAEYAEALVDWGPESVPVKQIYEENRHLPQFVELAGVARHLEETASRRSPAATPPPDYEGPDDSFLAFVAGVVTGAVSVVLTWLIVFKWIG